MKEQRRIVKRVVKKSDEQHKRKVVRHVAKENTETKPKGKIVNRIKVDKKKENDKLTQRVSLLFYTIMLVTVIAFLYNAIRYI